MTISLEILTELPEDCFLEELKKFEDNIIRLEISREKLLELSPEDYITLDRATKKGIVELRLVDG